MSLLFRSTNSKESKGVEQLHSSLSMPAWPDEFSLRCLHVQQPAIELSSFPRSVVEKRWTGSTVREETGGKQCQVKTVRSDRKTEDLISLVILWNFTTTALGVNNNIGRKRLYVVSCLVIEAEWRKRKCSARIVGDVSLKPWASGTKRANFTA